MISLKIDPYLRPLYDALYEMLVERVNKLLEKEIIEVAPLAYLRGRTLNNCFIIMDESQNTTKDQMKMVLTRMGYRSKAVINGDLTQIDLPKNITSGLSVFLFVMNEVKEIGVTEFNSSDVIGHPLVRKIIDAYKKFEDKHNSLKSLLIFDESGLLQKMSLQRCVLSLNLFSLMKVKKTLW